MNRPDEDRLHTMAMQALQMAGLACMDFIKEDNPNMELQVLRYTWQHSIHMDRTADDATHVPGHPQYVVYNRALRTELHTVEAMTEG